MKDITPYIKKAVEDVKMTDAERAYLWSHIEEYKAMKPIAHTARARASFNALPALAFALRPLAFALVLVVVFTGTISYAAESALPGNPLYTIKTQVNEPLRVALASTESERAEIQIELAERRIEEAAALAADEKLDSDTQEKLAIAFDTHAQQAAAGVETIEAADSALAVEISSRFETRLAAHESILTRVSSEREDDSRLKKSLRDAGRAIAEIRTRTEQKVAVSSAPDYGIATLAMDVSPMALSVASDSMMMKAAPAPMAESAPSEIATETLENSASESTAKRMQESAEKHLKVTQKLLKGSRSLNAETRTEAETELARAQALIEEGRAHLDSDSPALAFHSFQQSLIISEKLEVAVKSSKALQKARSQNKNVAAKRGDSTSTTQAPDPTENANARTLSLPDAVPALTTTLVTEDATAAGAASATIEAAFVPPAPSIPPPTQIYVPYGDLLQGVIKGASTSREEDNKGKGKKNEDDSDDHSGSSTSDD